MDWVKISCLFPPPTTFDTFPPPAPTANRESKRTERETAADGTEIRIQVTAGASEERKRGTELQEK
jgi:hypothetical protein